MKPFNENKRNVAWLSQLSKSHGWSLVASVSRLNVMYFLQVLHNRGWQGPLSWHLDLTLSRAGNIRSEPLQKTIDTYQAGQAWADDTKCQTILTSWPYLESQGNYIQIYKYKQPGIGLLILELTFDILNILGKDNTIYHGKHQWRRATVLTLWTRTLVLISGCIFCFLKFL